MYWESDMETYITICKIDGQCKSAVHLRELKQGLELELYHPRGVGWGERWEGTSRERGHKYTYD